MPIARVEIWSGRSAKFKAGLARAIPEVVVDKVGCPVEAVTVKIHESPVENWVIGGMPVTEMRK